MNRNYIDINYWSEIHDEIDQILNHLSGITLITHNSIKFSQIIKTLNAVNADKENNIVYISLIRSKGYIDSSLKFEPLNKKKISIIDCVSGYAFDDTVSNDNSFYNKPPSNLSELKEIINFGIDTYNPTIVVLDSLSQFINFSKIHEDEINQLYMFLETLKHDLKNKENLAFILLYDDKLGLLKNLPKGFVDKILKIEVVEEEINQKEQFITNLDENYSDLVRIT